MAYVRTEAPPHPDFPHLRSQPPPRFLEHLSSRPALWIIKKRISQDFQLLEFQGDLLPMLLINSNVTYNFQLPINELAIDAL